MIGSGNEEQEICDGPGLSSPGPPERNRRTPKKNGETNAACALCIHEDAELDEASEKVGFLYHRWSAPTEELVVKTSVLGSTKSCVGRGTKLRTEPILLHVAKHASHVSG